MIRLITNESELLEYKQDIISLFTRCFKRELTEEFWDWAYISSTSRSPIVSLMLHNEKVVGHYAVIAFDNSIRIWKCLHLDLHSIVSE